MVLAFVLIIVEPGKEKEATKALKSFKEVQELHNIYGEYDFICKLRTPDLKTLDEITTKMRKLKSIRATSTMITTE